MILKAILFFLLLYSSLNYSVAQAENRVTKQNCMLECQHINVNDLLYLIAKVLRVNIVISPSVHGLVSLHLEDISASDIFQLLLKANNLANWRIGNTFFIVTQDELLARKQEDIRLQQILQESEPLMARVWQIHFARAEEIAHLLQDSGGSFLSRKGHVRIDTRTNQLCVQDIQQSLQQVHWLIKKMDIPVQQVLIQAHLVSIDSDYESEIGIHFESIPDKMLNGHYSLALLKLASGQLLDVQLAALEKTGHAELISSPSLFTANQQVASIESGEEIPYQEVSASGATNVSFKKAVISLHVIPQIMPDNQVLLHLQVNQDKPNQRLVLGVPCLDTRQIKTNILVKNGQTIVLGGIYENNCEKMIERVPFLGKIPLLGLLFQQHNHAVSKRELLIFVRPIIIGSNNDL